jgi:hypothetical protein
MKTSLACLLVFFALLLGARFGAAQDQDTKKLMEIEQAFASLTNAGPDMAALYKQYLYDGNLTQVTGLGQIGTLSKSRIVALGSTQNPSDPDVKSSNTISDLHVDLYGSTALVSYKLTSTDTGHKDPALNATDHYACLDTFVKQKGQWYAIGNACSPSEPLPQVEWNAAKKAMTEMSKDVQEAYH